MQNTFDAVIYVNVLEHIEDDRKELSLMHQSLTNEGYALIFVPALSSLYSELDRKLGHFRRYHKKHLAQLIQDAGFKIVKATYFDLVGIVPWYIFFVLMKKTMTGANVHLYDNTIVPIMRKIEALISPPVGKNLLFIAKKV